MTWHVQPSAMLFERFDRLLFLAKGGKTVYFDEVGKNSGKLIDYFERHGGPKYQKGENPAEYILHAIGAAPGSHSDINWHSEWLESPERAAVREELARLRSDRPKEAGDKDKDPAAYKEFAAPLAQQFSIVTKRVFQQIWRSPTYIYSKIALVSIVGLFIGFSLFKADNSAQGMQNQLFGVSVISRTILCIELADLMNPRTDLLAVRNGSSRPHTLFLLIVSISPFSPIPRCPLYLQSVGLQTQWFRSLTLTSYFSFERYSGLTVFGQLCQQIMPHFVTQRSLYEIRERPSKTYSWKVGRRPQPLGTSTC